MGEERFAEFLKVADHHLDVVEMVRRRLERHCHNPSYKSRNEKSKKKRDGRDGRNTETRYVSPGLASLFSPPVSRN